MRRVLGAAAVIACAAACGVRADPSALQDSPAVDALCQSLAGRISELQVQRCRLAGLHAAGPRSANGQPLLLRDFHPETASKDSGSRNGRILLIGGIHGDELSAVAVVFQWLEQLKNDRFQHFEWRVMPCVNPDGVLANPSQRVNLHGVDLNRNFPTPDWGSRAMTYWAQKTHRDPRRFPGPSGGSEPETRWIMSEIQAFKPDAIVSVHAPYNLLDFDGPQTPPQKLGYLRLEPLGVYPGSLGNYGGLHLKLPVITMELPQAAHPPSTAQSGRIWADLLDWLQKNLHPATPH